jgi:hypothetical protein
MHTRHTQKPLACITRIPGEETGTAERDIHIQQDILPHLLTSMPSLPPRPGPSKQGDGCVHDDRPGEASFQDHVASAISLPLLPRPPQGQRLKFSALASRCSPVRTGRSLSFSFTEAHVAHGHAAYRRSGRNLGPHTEDRREVLQDGRLLDMMLILKYFIQYNMPSVHSSNTT